MNSVSIRELRNQTPEVVRRVQAGETVVLTLNRHPVADIVPHREQRTTVSWAQIEQIRRDAPADSGLLDELRDLLPDTTDDL